MSGDRFSNLLPTANIFVIPTAADLPQQLDRWRIYHLLFDPGAGTGLYFSPDEIILVKLAVGGGLALPVGTVDNSIIRWDTGLAIWDEFTTFIFPDTDGTLDQMMSTDGGGVVSWVDRSEVTNMFLSGLLLTILNLEQTFGASPISVDLAPILGLQRLQIAYDSAPAPPQITVNAVPDPLTIDASVTGFVFNVRDIADGNIFRVASAAQNTVEVGLGGQRTWLFQPGQVGRTGMIEYLPDNFTQTVSPIGACLQWDSVITSAIPGGGGLGNEVAPAMVASIGEVILTEQGFLFSTSLLFNQATTISCAAGNSGPLYTLVNQPNLRSTTAGSKTGSQANAVRSQMSVGPNILGDITLASHEPFFAAMSIDATVGLASATLVNYFAAKAPVLTAGGTIGTLNVMDIPNILPGGISTLRGINSAMASGTFINHTGAAISTFGGDIAAPTFNDVPLTDAGVATNYLDETGAYSVPVGTVFASLTEDIVTAGGPLLTVDASVGNNPIAILSMENLGVGAIGLDVGGVGSVASNWSVWRSTDQVGTEFWECIDDHVLSSGNHRLSWRNQAGTRFIELQNSGIVTIFGSGGLGVINVAAASVGISSGATLYLDELAAANAEITDHGQFWVRNDVPNVPMFTDDTGIDYNLLEVQGGSTIIAAYRFQTSIVEADPGAGNLRYDNATPASVTELFISSTTDNGVDFQNILSFIASGDRIYVQQDNDATKFLLFDVTVNVDNTGWFSIAGTVSNSGTIPDSNAKIHILILFGAAGGAGGTLPAGVVEGDSLAWDGVSAWRVAFGVDLPQTAGPPPAGEGYIVLSTTGTVAERQPQIWASALNTISVMYTVEHQANNAGFYLRTRGNVTPARHTWGSYDALVDVDLFEITESNEFNMLAGAAFYVGEKAAAAGDKAAFGQVWVRNDAPNNLMFTDDVGTDFVIGGAGAVGVDSFEGRTGVVVGVITDYDGVGLLFSDNVSLLLGNSSDINVQFDGTDGAFTGPGAPAILTFGAWAQVRVAGALGINEAAAPDGDVAGVGQFWVRNDIPNTPMFRDDAGTDFVLNATTIPDPLTVGRAILTNTSAIDLVDTVVALNVGAVDPDISQHLELSSTAIQSKNGTGSPINIDINPVGAGVQLFSGGAVKLQTVLRGIQVLGNGVNDPATGGTQQSQILLQNAGGVIVGKWGFGLAATTTMQLLNDVQDGIMEIIGTNTALSDTLLFRGDPNAGSAMYNAGTQVFRTLAAASGGAELNNLLTGAGFERVLTTADLVVAGGQVNTVVGGTNINVNAADPVNPIVNLDAAITATSVNAVTLSAVGVATNYLDETGAYSVPVGSSSSPGGADTELQYNNGGAFGGIPQFTFNDVATTTPQFALTPLTGLTSGNLVDISTGATGDTGALLALRNTTVSNGVIPLIIGQLTTLASIQFTDTTPLIQFLSATVVSFAGASTRYEFDAPVQATIFSLLDNAQLRFGTGPDITMDWDGVDMEVEGLAASQIWNWRDGGRHRWYDPTDAQYLEIQPISATSFSINVSNPSAGLLFTGANFYRFDDVVQADEGLQVDDAIASFITFEVAGIERSSFSCFPTSFTLDVSGQSSGNLFRITDGLDNLWEMAAGAGMTVWENNADVDNLNIQLDGTDAIFAFTGAADVQFTGGVRLQIFQTSSTNAIQLQCVAGQAIIGSTSGIHLEIQHSGVVAIQTQLGSATGNTAWAFIRDNNSIDHDIGYNDLRVFNDNVSDTLEANHAGQMAFKDATTARTLTLASNVDLDFPVHAMTTVLNAFTSGNYTITEGASTTLYYLDGATRIDTAGGATLGPGGVANIWRESATVYYIWGTGITP